MTVAQDQIWRTALNRNVAVQILMLSVNIQFSFVHSKAHENNNNELHWGGINPLLIMNNRCSYCLRSSVTVTSHDNDSTTQTLKSSWKLKAYYIAFYSSLNILRTKETTSWIKFLIIKTISPIHEWSWRKRKYII